MEWLDVLKHIESGENRHTEFKREASDLARIGRAICAFANTEGGVIILGVDDAGDIVGVSENAEKLQERLTSFLQSGCSAPVSARIGHQKSPRGWVHWIDVPRQRGFEPLRCDGRVWIRRERSSVEPSSPELQELYNAFGYVLTEDQVILSATADDIDTRHFQGYLRAQGIQTVENPQPAMYDDLKNRAVLAEFSGQLHPTLYGLLAFGRNPQGHPQTGNFRVDCVVYEGGGRASDTLSVGEIDGRLDEQVRRAMEWSRILGKGERYRGIVREDIPFVPDNALREAIINAVVHRDYAITGSKVMVEVFSDRVDITSPGTLPNRKTVASVQAGGNPRSRNELMANYMLVKGYAGQRGQGWPIIQNAMHEFNGTEAELMEDRDGKFVRVTLRL